MKYLVKQGGMPFNLVIDAGSHSEALLRAAIVSISYFGVKTAPALTTVRNHAGESANVAHFEVGATESIESWLRMLFEECHADVAQCYFREESSGTPKFRS